MTGRDTCDYCLAVVMHAKEARNSETDAQRRALGHSLWEKSSTPNGGLLRDGPPRDNTSAASYCSPGIYTTLMAEEVPL